MPARTSIRHTLRARAARSAHAQRGLSLLSLVIVGGLIALVGLVFAQALPTIIEYQAITKAVERAKTESSPVAIRAAFDRSASIDAINSITGKDLSIAKGTKDNFVVNFAYNREIHLAGPAYLLLKYTGSAS